MLPFENVNEGLPFEKEEGLPFETTSGYSDYSKAYDTKYAKAQVPGTIPEKKMTPEEWAKEQDSSKMSIPRLALGAAEVGLNTIGGIGGMAVAPIGAALNSVNNLVQGNSANFEDTYHKLMGMSGSAGTSLADLANTALDTNKFRTHAGDIGNEYVGEAVRQLGIPSMGVNIPIRPAQAAWNAAFNKEIGLLNTIKENNTAAFAKAEMPNVKTTYEPNNPAAWENKQFKVADEQAARERVAASNEIAQQPLFDQPSEGRVASPYEAKLGDWRIDENGMPIKADLSMDVQNASQPLQRNLWGDELQPTRNPVGQAADLFAVNGQQEGVPLPEAIDSMDWAHRRGAINSHLRGDVEPSGRLLSAIDEANRQAPGSNNPSLYGGSLKGQGGAINPKVFDDGYKVVKRLTNGLTLLLQGGESGPRVYALDKDRNIVGTTKFGRDNWAQEMSPKDNLEATWVTTDPKQVTSVINEGEKTTKSAYPGLAGEMYKFASEQGNDIVQSKSQTQDGADMWAGFRARGIAQGNKISRGVADMSFVGDTLDKIAKHFRAIDGLTSAEKQAMKSIGDDSFVLKGDSPDVAIPAILAEGKDGPSLNNYMQSGLQNAATKVDSGLMQYVARWIGYGEKLGNKHFQEYVKPLEKLLSSASDKDLMAVLELRKKEMFERKSFTNEELAQAGISPNVAAISQALKDSNNNLRLKLNASRESLGLDPLKENDAYYSSMFNGNWHVPVYDKEGRIVWYIKTETRKEANNAVEWLKQNHGATLDLEKTAPRYSPSDISGRLPRDVTDTYKHVMSIFKDTPFADEMASLMTKFQEEQAFNSRSFKVHFENKANVRGFLGDRPWLSDKENTIQGMKAQMQYLRDGYRWAPLQEAMANIKEVLSNPDILEQQPNNAKLAKMYAAQAMGVTDNLFRGATNRAAEFFGVSPATFSHIVGDVKTWTYIQQLGFSPGYMLATPLQAFVLGPALHMKLSGMGYKYNFLSTMSNSIIDTVAVLGTHEWENMTGKQSSVALSDLGQAAKRYMEDNGIINISLFDEYKALGEHRITNAIKRVGGWTISAPEKVARISTFMSFVHHLEESGKYADKKEMFRYAEELTNDTLTNFHKSARPLVVDSTGLAGELAYTYKSPIFNYYNNLISFAQHGKRTGDYRPLATALATTGAMGGLFAMPLVNELDDAWLLLKGMVAKHAPALYTAKLPLSGKSIKDLKTIKEFALANFHDSVTYGSISVGLGAQLASRFSTKVADVENPLSQVAPVAQEVKEAIGTAGAVLHPNSTGVVEALYPQAPPIGKGIIENTASTLLGPKQKNGQIVYNPNQLPEHNPLPHLRTEADKNYRYAGLYSLNEARDKDVNYMNNRVSKMNDEARQQSITLLFDAIKRKDTDSAQRYARSYFDAEGTNVQADITKAITRSQFTPQQAAVLRANTLAELMNVKRRMAMEKH